MPEVKICGLKDSETLNAAVAAGADYIGLVFYPPSPRFVDTETAAALARSLPESVQAAGLFVDPDEAFLDSVLQTVKLDLIQLHGGEPPERVRALRDRTGLPVMTAIRVGGPEDLDAVPAYEDVADRLLFDARPPGAKLPGGTGQSFDWALLEGLTFAKPWMLSGGLTPENVGEALSRLHPGAVDVSSGVESAPGVKDPAKIEAFIRAVREHE